MMTLSYFMARLGQHRSPMHLNGEKLLECRFKEKSCCKWAVGLNINDSEKKSLLYG